MTLAAWAKGREEIKAAFDKQKTEFEQDEEAEATAAAVNAKFATDPDVFIGAFGSVDEFIAGVTAQVRALSIMCLNVRGKESACNLPSKRAKRMLLHVWALFQGGCMP